MNVHSARVDDSSIDETGAWLSISDLMAGILMIFVLLLISTLARLMEFDEQANKNRVIIIEGLQAELQKANIDSIIDPETGSMSLESSVLFTENSSQLKPKGKQFLDKLIPIYSQVIFQSDEISDEVLFLVIEGHADSREKPRKAMSLSMRRAESVIEYIDGMIFHYKGKFLKKILAAGRGSLDANSKLTAKQNRKVLFRFEFQSHDLTELMGKPQ
jgi:outer membrane protein OmpA-like peptidoglycan-associated protein